MIRNLPLLFLGLVLFTSACQKEKTNTDPQPKPSLEGRWIWQHAVITRYDVNNEVIQTTPQAAAPGATYLDINGETLQRFLPDGTALTPPLNYVQDGSTIYYDRARAILTIVDLTSRELTLHAEGEFIPGRGHTNTDTYYSR
ncbi:hypothetical protein SAMN06265337_0676 [Hymenobacter gelipurpurascens]|uniref:Lipocalin-like domain-containing protein n=1 Tax=Hymenobacter gelipurpurascens TaxID=89968 RepID=A0A212T9I5_9BACT|nr:hypothetical protein [Hymenobacter gelipurpurascens]SNC62464.1 hypothetical protein SAMN06265337_0676 [Hymenobacter gelipurpurascens]